MNTWPKTDFQTLYLKKNFNGVHFSPDVIITGDCFYPLFSLKEIENDFYDWKTKKYANPENMYKFFSNDSWLVFNLEEVVLLGCKFTKEFHNRFSLKPEERRWEKWDPYIFKLCVEDKRKNEDRNFSFKNLNLEFWES